MMASSYKTELKTIKGLSATQVNEVLTEYPTREKLLSALALQHHLTLDEQIAEKIKTHFKEESTKKWDELKKDIALVKIRSLQPDITIQRAFNPSFKIRFGKDAIEVRPEVAEYLLKTSKNFEKV